MDQSAAIATGAENVSIGLVPSSTVVSIGEIFTLPIQIEAGAQPVDGAEAHIDFDPAYLKVVDADGVEVDRITEITAALDTVLQNVVDNDQGAIGYAAGVLTDEPPTGTFDLASIRLKAIAETAGTPLSFAFTHTRKTEVVFEGRSVLGDHVDGNVVITAYRRRVYLPLILRRF